MSKWKAIAGVPLRVPSRGTRWKSLVQIQPRPCPLRQSATATGSHSDSGLVDGAASFRWRVVQDTGFKPGLVPGPRCPPFRRSSGARTKYGSIDRREYELPVVIRRLSFGIALAVSSLDGVRTRLSRSGALARDEGRRSRQEHRNPYAPTTRPPSITWTPSRSTGPISSSMASPFRRNRMSLIFRTSSDRPQEAPPVLVTARNAWGVWSRAMRASVTYGGRFRRLRSNAWSNLIPAIHRLHPPMCSS
jgi:hypothetical protein